MFTIDINADLGEGAGYDEQLCAMISSASIACGGHTGNEQTIRETIQLARKFGVRAGAHPSFDDPANFGRVQMEVPPAELYETIRLQLLRFQQIADDMNYPMLFVKPHGALYNMASKERGIARIIAEVVWSVNPRLLLYGLSGSMLLEEGRARKLQTVSEVFADRQYEDDGTLSPRSRNGAVITDVEIVSRRVAKMVRFGTIESANGNAISVNAETVCVHGDGINAVELCRRMSDELKRQGILIAAPVIAI